MSTMLDKINDINDFRVINDKCPIGIYVLDCNYNLIYANESAEKILGFKTERISGRDWLFSILNEDRNKVLKSYKCLSPYSFDFRLNNNGKIRYLRSKVVFVKELGFINCLEDITINNFFLEELIKIKSI